MTGAHPPVASAAAHPVEEVPGGVCAPPGISASGVAAGLKPSGRPDLALVAADRPVAAAAVQTRNQVAAAPVVVTRRHVGDGRARAVLLNAGQANAATGAEGIAVAEASAAAVADGLGCAPGDVLLCSTGVIGVVPPRDTLLAGIPGAVAGLSPDGGTAAAEAIRTTDTAAKEAAAVAGGCVVGGMAKGSGMIEPGMATMLAVLTTDAPVPGPGLAATLRDAVERTFGRISVDGCMSTNDAVVLLATGTARAAPAPGAFAAAVQAVCGRLAEAIVRDGEGATKLVRVHVTGARTESEAVAVGRAVADSVLVRTALAGGDPNWGRVLAAAGAGPVPLDPDRVEIGFGEVTVCRSGVAAPFDESRAAAALRGPEIDLTVDLGTGPARATFLTCDLTHGYITINAEYTT